MKEGARLWRVKEEEGDSGDESGDKDAPSQKARGELPTGFRRSPSPRKAARQAAHTVRVTVRAAGRHAVRASSLVWKRRAAARNVRTQIIIDISGENDCVLYGLTRHPDWACFVYAKNPYMASIARGRLLHEVIKN
uniref:Uncharacterized protein n=1 Tax=Chromera velia CCMP2878 TaxID=1169474 RepID=A0A0G4H9L2_9ALVE|eukprot:Cvel_25353.t1-p1 / transcript=Cvel_25353.t1 / gene=Cvel_25353 / organism=Chromera_velia_CCMP2878 / gene_product=hypothetical protein / transcript_product=hypothetical protein / location=Cvel_scaffold2860:11092-11496(+) / protein_length=135 / sequence_SO=supercontig / SO=protein_coding / is_pseudo=false